MLDVVPVWSVDNVLSARSVRKLRLRSNCSGVSGKRGQSWLDTASAATSSNSIFVGSCMTAIGSFYHKPHDRASSFSSRLRLLDQDDAVECGRIGGGTGIDSTRCRAGADDGAADV